MRWIVLEEILSIEPGSHARATGRLPEASEAAAAELLVLEMAAQTGGLVAGAQTDFRDDFIFAKIERADFFGPWAPASRFEIEARAEGLRAEGGWIDASVTCRGEKAAEVRFLLMNVGRLAPEKNSSITFHETFMNHFRVREKVR